ncbi:MAG: ABC transporter permease, partial [Verrucomicrobia bacterium]|nr:ABC transporter permease [Verrucomicrobiota bacterium]
MSLWSDWVRRLRAWFRKEELDAELDEELRFHLEMQTRENVEAGLDPDEARCAALRSFGRVDRVKETCREQRGWVWIEHLVQDLRFGARLMGKQPGSTALAILILALGIGGNTAVFSVVDRTMLRPIPGREADRLISLREVDVMHQARWSVSPLLFTELARRTNLFASLAAYFQSADEFTFGHGTNGLKLHGATVTPGFFGVLEARQLAGRTFLPHEGRPGHDKVLVASYGLWQQHFAGDPEFVGRTIVLGGQAYTVIGIMPPTFQFPFSPGENQFWIPHVFAGEETTNPEWIANRMWAVIGRLEKGVSLAQTRAYLDTVAQRREREHPEPNTQWVIEAMMARTLFVGPNLEPTLWSLQAAVGMLLLIACANVGTLLLARAVARRGELSIRMAIGAGRFRVTRQLITESLLLAAFAGLLGIFFAWGGIRALDNFYLGNLPRMRVVGLDGSVLGLTLLVSTATGLVFGVAPAWMVSQLRLHDSLKDTSQQQVDSAVQRLFRDGLVVAQVSLAVVLLAGAGLVIDSMLKLLRVDPGLDPKGLYRVIFDPGPLMRITRPDAAALKQGGAIRRQAIAAWFAKEIQTELRWDETMVARLRAIPGVESAAIGVGSGAAYSYGDFRVEGRDDLVQLSSDYIGVRSGDYFHTLRLPLVAGRLLTRDDAMPGQEAVVV